MNKDYDYSCSNLAFWLQLDNWTVREGLCLLCEIDPDGANIDWEGYESPYGGWVDLPRLHTARFLRANKKPGEARIMLELVSRFWRNGSHDKERYPPSDLIRWASEKGIPVPWRRWAQTHGFLSDSAVSGSELHDEGRTWPWGEYETDLLRKLAEAAAKFWNLPCVSTCPHTLSV